MSGNERLVRLIVARSQRLSTRPAIDRDDVGTVPGVPARPVPARPDRPRTPWEAVVGQLCEHGTVDPTSAGDQLLDVLLEGEHTTPDDLRALLARPSLGQHQRIRILQHSHAPGELVVAYLVDERHDRPSFDESELREQLAMAQHMSGVDGERRLAAWAALTLRAALSRRTEHLVGEILIASPNAGAVLHATVMRSLARTRSLPEAMSRHLMSHMAAPATIALLSLTDLLEMIDRAEEGGLSTERLADVICDLVAASCGEDPARWSRFFQFATVRVDRSLRELLDDIEDDNGEAALRRRRRDVPGYQRQAGSALLKPIDYSSMAVRR